jgi:hypothetical protein
MQVPFKKYLPILRYYAKHGTLPVQVCGVLVSTVKPKYMEATEEGLSMRASINDEDKTIPLPCPDARFHDLVFKGEYEQFYSYLHKNLIPDVSERDGIITVKFNGYVRGPYGVALEGLKIDDTGADIISRGLRRHFLPRIEWV